MTDKLEALSQPVVYGLFEFSSNKLYHSMQDKLDAENYLNQVHQSNDSITLNIEPLYSQEYVTALIQRAVAAEQQLAALPADWSKDSSLETWFPLSAARLAELEQRLQQPIKLHDLKNIARHAKIAGDTLVEGYIKTKGLQCGFIDKAVTHIDIVNSKIDDMIKASAKVEGE